MGGYTYIMASAPYGALYVGVTANVVGRAIQHREKDTYRRSAFCKRYGVDKLVWYERFEDIRDAIHREKRLKKWPRQWKINLIERGNPTWRDLFLDFPEAHPLGVPGSPLRPPELHAPAASDKSAWVPRIALRADRGMTSLLMGIALRADRG